MLYALFYGFNLLCDLVLLQKTYITQTSNVTTSLEALTQFDCCRFPVHEPMMLSRARVTVDGVWVDNRIYWTL
jgi:hypothetical protein